MFILLLLVTYVYGHSWLHCVDYDRGGSLNVGAINNNLCRKYPRGVTSSAVFGADVGFDYIANNAAPCKFPPGAPISLSNGVTYRMIWPAKNHQADVCTNPFIPDTRMQLYVIPGGINQPDPTLNEWSSARFLVKDFKENGGPGFQNCPDFCPVTDRVPCFGDFQLPNLQNGPYKALWLWEFNRGQIYTHCFDFIVGPPASSPSPTPSSSSPTPSSSSPTPGKPTIKPTGKPTGKPTSIKPTQSPSNCVKQYDQCGGNNFQGITKCCGSLTCQKLNDFYSQCVLAPGNNCVGRFLKCGGRGYTGPTNCCAGSCKTINDFHSQCE